MKYTKKVLKNGLKIFTVPHKDSLAATVLVLVEAGSKYEAKKVNGISHFLEHMCFKGTKNRPRALDISSELDGIGAQYNAFTGHEYTGYYAKVQSQYISKALDIVSDIYLNPAFNESEIEKEKGVIVEEINMYEDLPQRKVQDLILKLLYGEQPAAWPITGEREVVRGFKREDFVAYRGAHYVPASTTVVIAGKFDEKKIWKEMEARFGMMPHGKKSGKIKTKDVQTKPEALVTHKKSDQTHLVLAFRSYNTHDKRGPIMDVLAATLGGGMSSRLFQKVREELGAAYYVGSSADGYTDHGLLNISAGVDNARAKEVISAILGECKRLTTELVPEKELKTVKDSLVGSLVLGLETSDAQAVYFGGQEVLKKVITTPEEYAKKIKAVTAKDVLRVAKDIFKDAKLNLALIGPFEKGDEFVRILHL